VLLKGEKNERGAVKVAADAVAVLREKVFC